MFPAVVAFDVNPSTTSRATIQIKLKTYHPSNAAASFCETGQVVFNNPIRVCATWASTAGPVRRLCPASNGYLGSATRQNDSSVYIYIYNDDVMGKKKPPAV